MKKIYALLAAALMSASLFAAPSMYPSVANLSGYDTEKNVVVCFYFDTIPCNDIVWVGTYLKDDKDAWITDIKKLTRFQPLSGFDDWYVAEIPYSDNFQGKPVQLKKEYNQETGREEEVFSWDFQAGDVDAWRYVAGEAATVTPGFDNEANVAFSKAGAYIYEIKYWKKKSNPCIKKQKYTYTFYMFNPDCPDEDFTPEFVGDFDGWSGSPMAKAVYDGDVAYTITIVDEADHEYKFRAKGDTDWKNQLQEKDAAGNWGYINQGKNFVLPALTTGTDTTIVYEFYDTDKYKYEQCGLEVYDITLIATLPANAPEIVELMGNFKGGVWNGTGVIMTKEEDGTYTAQIQGDDTNQFKFRSGVGSDEEKWANQIYAWDDQTSAWKESDNFTFGLEDWEEGEEVDTYICTVDLSDEEAYRWGSEVPTGLENVVLTEKARKVVIDGQIYITRDNKLFNIHGAQLR
jgi:hypothetical protein